MADVGRDIEALITEFGGREPDAAGRDDLLGRLGLDGDDAFEFIEAFASRFSVDISGYRWEFHHADEGALLNPGWPFKAPHQKVERIPLTLDLLTEAAMTGIWPLEYPPDTLGTGRPDVWNGLIVFAGLGLIGGCAIWLMTWIM